MNSVAQIIQTNGAARLLVPAIRVTKSQLDYKDVEMNSARTVMKTGLALAVMLTTMAVLAGTAQAAWLITLKVPLEASTHTELNFKVPTETNLEILCSTVAADGLYLIAETTEGEGKIKVSTCKTWQSGALKSACKPKEPIALNGKAKLLLHNGSNYILLEPELGKIFGVVKFEVPCALPESNNIKGSLVVECAELSGGSVISTDCAKMSTAHLLRSAPSALFESDGLLYGASKKATLEGVTSLSLAGEYFGSSWSGHV
jgi:hypothetical protein